MSRLLDVLSLLYRMESDDIAQLEAQLLERRKAEWITAMSELAVKHGCNRRGVAPRLQDLSELKRMAGEEARQIAATWNRESRRQLEKLRSQNPRGNRFYYARGMAEWETRRNPYKSAQIALQTAQTTRWYAQGRFREVNNLFGSRYIFTGPPPVCNDCLSLFSRGTVSEHFIQRHPTPIHVNCPHEWQELQPEQIPCDVIWVG